MSDFKFDAFLHALAMFELHCGVFEVAYKFRLFAHDATTIRQPGTTPEKTWARNRLQGHQGEGCANIPGEALPLPRRGELLLLCGGD